MFTALTTQTVATPNVFVSLGQRGMPASKLSHAKMEANLSMVTASVNRPTNCLAAVPDLIVNTAPSSIRAIRPCVTAVPDFLVKSAPKFNIVSMAEFLTQLLAHANVAPITQER